MPNQKRFHIVYTDRNAKNITMKTIHKIATVLSLFILNSSGLAQVINVCAGSSTVVTAVNSLSLTNPTYSLNPGGLSSVNPNFTVTPASSTTYTLYVTGTNASSSIITTSTTETVNVSGVTYTLVSPVAAFTLGCASKSVCGVSVINAQTTPVPGGAITYSFLPPGSSTVLPNGQLSANSNVSITVPGIWSVVVRDPVTMCTFWSTMTITLNNSTPTIGSLSVSQHTLSCNTSTTLVQAVSGANVQHTWLPSSIQNNSIIITSNPSAPSQSLAVTLTLVATDVGNFCETTSVVPIYQNLFEPNAQITGPFSPIVCQDSVVLVNTSSTGIPLGVFPANAPVLAVLWAGPSPQQSLTLSSVYIAKTAGIYTMVVNDNNNGCTNSTTINLSSAWFSPSAAFTHTLTGGVAAFNNISTGTSTNSIYFWDFGDGTTSSIQNPTHTYVSAGSHLVKFKVQHPGINCVDSVIQSVNVSGIPCVANSGFSMVPTNTAQVWDVIPSYPWNVVAANWSWGDGSSSNTLYTSHQYSAAGMYTICLSVTVSCVASSSTCTSYSVYRTFQPDLILEIRVKSPELISGFSPSEPIEQFSWNISPNPNNGEFSLKLNRLTSQNMRVFISDLSGRIVYDQAISSGQVSLPIHPENLASGLYLITLESNNSRLTKRMVVCQ